MAGSRARIVSPATPEAPSSYRLETGYPGAGSNPEPNAVASEHHANVNDGRHVRSSGGDEQTGDNSSRVNALTGSSGMIKALRNTGLPVVRARWLSLAATAALLDMAAGALRRTIERRARLAADGVLEATFDGIRARKFAGRWRINLGPGWNSEELPNTGAARATHSARSEHASRLAKE